MTLIKILAEQRFKYYGPAITWGWLEWTKFELLLMEKTNTPRKLYYYLSMLDFYYETSSGPADSD